MSTIFCVCAGEIQGLKEQTRDVQHIHKRIQIRVIYYWITEKSEETDKVLDQTLNYFSHHALFFSMPRRHNFRDRHMGTVPNTPRVRTLKLIKVDKIEYI